MKFCKRCLYPENHPLNIIFDKDGICSGCRVHEEKDTLNWDERERELRKLLEKYKNKSLNYDCVIPVDGGKDSYFIVDLIKNKYNLKPLVVSYNKQYNTLSGIRNLQYLKTMLGVDCIESTINPFLAKKLVRYTFEKMGSIYWHNHLGSKTFPVQIAAKFKIPLIIWGVHQGIDQVGMFSHTDEVEMSRKYRKEFDLMGYEAEDVISEKDEIYERDMQKFFYPTDKEIEYIGIRGIYLGNYIRWDSKVQHEKMIQKYNYETLEQTRTFNPYDNVDCFLYSDLHDYIKFIKFGYSKVNDHVAREIRLAKMNVEEGMSLIKKYQTVKPRFFSNFSNWSEINKKEFFKTLDKFRDNRAWTNNNGDWVLKDSIENHISESSKYDLDLNKGNIYNINRRTDLKEKDFVLMHKGWIDEQ